LAVAASNKSFASEAATTSDSARTVASISRCPPVGSVPLPPSHHINGHYVLGGLIPKYHPGGRVANSLPGMAAHVTDDMQLEPSGRFATENTLPLPQRPTWSPVSGKACPKTRSRLAHRDIEAPRYVSNSGIGGRNRHAGVLRQRTFALATGIE